jgi:hypothetical protein
MTKRRRKLTETENMTYHNFTLQNYDNFDFV